MNDVRFLCNFLFNFNRSCVASSFSFNPSVRACLLSLLASDKSKHIHSVGFLIIKRKEKSKRCDDDDVGSDAAIQMTNFVDSDD